MTDDKGRPVTLDEMLACVKREIGMRKSVYPRWVKAGKMKQAVADNEIRVMEGVFDCLSRLQRACRDQSSNVEAANAAAMESLAVLRKSVREFIGG